MFFGLASDSVGFFVISDYLYLNKVDEELR